MSSPTFGHSSRLAENRHYWDRANPRRGARTFRLTLRAALVVGANEACSASSCACFLARVFRSSSVPRDARQINVGVERIVRPRGGPHRAAVQSRRRDHDRQPAIERSRARPALRRACPKLHQFGRARRGPDSQRRANGPSSRKRPSSEAAGPLVGAGRIRVVRDARRREGQPRTSSSPRTGTPTRRKAGRPNASRSWRQVANLSVTTSPATSS